MGGSCILCALQCVAVAVHMSYGLWELHCLGVAVSVSCGLLHCGGGKLCGGHGGYQNLTLSVLGLF